MSCKVALLRMHRARLIALPAIKRAAPQCRKKTDVGMLLPLPQSLIILSAEQLRHVCLDVVQTQAERAIYHQLMQAHHYLGAASMAGAQLRYFARSGGEVVSALGFGASAWLVAGRDCFIGWLDSSRHAGLHLVVNNKRFLIPPWVQTRNLASRLLSLLSRRIAADWLNRYGYSPVLLETFVELERFTGACYRAANWIEVGTTKGRGKLKKNYQRVLPLKTSWSIPSEKTSAPSSTDELTRGSPNIYYGSESLPSTLLMVNPARRLLDKTVKECNRHIRKLQAELGAAKPDLDGESIQWRAERLEDIQMCMKEKADLCLQRRSTPKKVTISSLPEAERPTQLLPMAKILTDTVKMIAYRAETALVGLLRKHLKKEDEARALVRELLVSSADILPNEKENTLTIRIHRMACPAHDKAISSLLADLTKATFHHPQTGARIVHK